MNHFRKFLFIIVVAGLSIPVFSEAAIGISVLPNDSASKPFDLKVRDISKVFNSDITRFEFNTFDPNTDGGSVVDRWEIRVWCDDNSEITLDALLENVCNKSNIALKDTPTNFSLFLKKNKGNYPARFSFKLKAFKEDGTWIHSEKRVFFW